MKVGPGPRLILLCEQVEGGDNVGEVGDEFAIEVRKSEKGSDALDRGGWFPFFNGGKFDRVHLNPSLADNHAKKFDAWDVKGAFGEFERKSVLPESKEYVTGSFVMECEVALGVDSEVVHIDLEPALSNHICEDVIHERLERRWSITKTKEHNGGFEKSKRSDECSLPLVFLMNADIVKSPSDVKFGEYGGVFHVVD